MSNHRDPDPRYGRRGVPDPKPELVTLKLHLPDDVPRLMLRDLFGYLGVELPAEEMDPAITISTTLTLRDCTPDAVEHLHRGFDELFPGTTYTILETDDRHD